MDGASTTPPLPPRSRVRNQRQPGHSNPNGSRPNDPNRVLVQPASPEVISNLITSLSIISAPASHLFEESTDGLPLSPTLSFTPSSRFPVEEAPKSPRGGGSFGIDYGAYKQPSSAELGDHADLDEIAATPPVIKTAKPPSGFSVHTAPRSPAKDISFKSFLRVSSSRPVSRGSNDDASSIGTPSIEPGNTPELNRQTSGDSWGKKQSRSKSLMYAGSKERLRDTERKRTSVAASSDAVKGLGLEKVAMPSFEADSFMSELTIKEEAVLVLGNHSLAAAKTKSIAGSPSFNGNSPILSSGVPGTRQIPHRDSSLRNRKSTSKHRSSPASQSSRPEGRSKGTKGEIDKEFDEKLELGGDDEKIERKGRQSSVVANPLQSPSKLPGQESDKLAYTKISNSLESKTHLKAAGRVTQPSGVGSSKTRPLEEERSKRPSSKEREKSASATDTFLKREASRLKRFSAPSTSNTEKSKVDAKLTRRSDIIPELKSSLNNIEDRPTSADSIDDAVDAYLCSPRLSQRIRHPQTGRVISFSEVGDSEGHAVFCCVGMGLTRYITAFYDDLALTLRLRLITPDRPGVGDSEPYTDGTSTPLSWPDDVYAICQALKITKFSILAHSAGAIYALATALRMPQHIRGRIHLLAPWIPPSQLNVFSGKQTSPPTNSIPTSQRILRALPTPILKAANSSFMSATSSSITSSLPKNPRKGKRRSTTAGLGRDIPALDRSHRNSTYGLDKENLGPGMATKTTPSSLLHHITSESSNPNQDAAVISAAANSLASKERQTVYDTRLTHAIWDLATCNANPAVDLLVCLERRHTIGFRYVDIARAVVIHHGSKDSRVPVENVKWLGKMMRRCEVRILEGEGHGLMASAGVMGNVLMEIAREWEDWMQVVQIKDGTARKTLRERASVGAFR